MRDHLRDYATSAFRFYAVNGKSSDKYRHKLYKQALEQQQKADGSYGISKPTEAAIMRAEKTLDEKMAEIKDMEAVENTVNIIQRMGNGSGVLKAISYVYFDTDKLKKGSIEERVHVAEIHIPASRASIYRWLKQARNLFANERGLRI